MNRVETNKKEFTIYRTDNFCKFHAEWINGKLDLGIDSTFFLTSEESCQFVDWLYNNKPKKKYKINKKYDYFPTQVCFGETGECIPCKDEDIEEVWE